MSEPINHAVAELLFYIAKWSAVYARTAKFEYVPIGFNQARLDSSVHAEELGFIERPGTDPSIDWPFVRLTAKGKAAVSAAIYAMESLQSRNDL